MHVHTKPLIIILDSIFSYYSHQPVLCILLWKYYRWYRQSSPQPLLLQPLSCPPIHTLIPTHEYPHLFPDFSRGLPSIISYPHSNDLFKTKWVNKTCEMGVLEARRVCRDRGQGNRGTVEGAKTKNAWKCQKGRESVTCKCIVPFLCLMTS